MPTGGLTDRQVAEIERLKHLMGIDDRVGRDLSEAVGGRRQGMSIAPVSAQEGKDISERIFNPTIIRLIQEFEKITKG